MKHSSHGFTLLELLLAMAVFAAMASVVLPIAGGMLRDRQLIRGADQLQAEIMRARVRAMKEGRVLMVQANEGSNLILIQPLFSSADLTQGAGTGGPASALLSGADQAMGTVDVDSLALISTEVKIELPETISVKSLATSPVGGSQSVEAASLLTPLDSPEMGNDAGESSEQIVGSPLPIVYLYPTGQTSNAIFTLTDDREQTRTVHLRGLTGGLEIGQ